MCGREGGRQGGREGGREGGRQGRREGGPTDMWGTDVWNELRTSVHVDFAFMHNVDAD